MKKCTACAFSSTRKDRRPKKCTIPLMACSMDCHALGGGGGGLAASKGAPGHLVNLSKELYLDTWTICSLNQFKHIVLLGMGLMIWS